MTKDGIEVVQTQELLKPENKKRIFEEEPFIIYFPTSDGAVEFVSGEPRAVIDNDMRNALVGGQTRADAAETHWTGLVPIHLPTEIYGNVYGGATKTRSKEKENEAKEAWEKAKKESHERCLEAAKAVFNNMLSQKKMIEEGGSKQVYKPSVTERLCTIVLEDSLAAQSREQERLDADFEAKIANITSQVNQ